MTDELMGAESLDCWHREGPARMRTTLGKSGAESFLRVNQPRACLSCKKRRIRCSAFETGSPCAGCKKSGVACQIGEDSYSSNASHQTTVFVPVLPPPRPPCSTPSEGSAKVFKLDVEALAERLKVSGARPAPLVWKSVDEIASAIIRPIPISTRAKRSLPQPTTSEESSDDAPPVISKTPRSLSISAPKPMIARSVDLPFKSKPVAVPSGDGQSLTSDGLLLAVFAAGSKTASPLGEAARRARSREWFSVQSSQPTSDPPSFSFSTRTSSVRDQPLPSAPSALHLTRPDDISTSHTASSLHRDTSTSISSLARLLNPFPSSAFHSSRPSYNTQGRSFSLGDASDWFVTE